VRGEAVGINTLPAPPLLLHVSRSGRQMSHGAVQELLHTDGAASRQRDVGKCIKIIQKEIENPNLTSAETR
jgi:hypothetical protein